MAIILLLTPRLLSLELTCFNGLVFTTALLVFGWLWSPVMLTCYEISFATFAYLFRFLCSQESERKAYNPRSFCKVYQMDHQPLNTGEQKDMAEFFIDLVSKLEEMTPELKKLVKTLFCGVLSNNVVSLVSNVNSQKTSIAGHKPILQRNHL